MKEQLIDGLSQILIIYIHENGNAEDAVKDSQFSRKILHSSNKGGSIRMFFVKTNIILADVDSDDIDVGKSLDHGHGKPSISTAHIQYSQSIPVLNSFENHLPVPVMQMLVHNFRQPLEENAFQRTSQELASCFPCTPILLG